MALPNPITDLPNIGTVANAPPQSSFYDASVATIGNKVSELSGAIKSTASTVQSGLLGLASPSNFKGLVNSFGSSQITNFFGAGPVGNAASAVANKAAGYVVDKFVSAAGSNVFGSSQQNVLNGLPEDAAITGSKTISSQPGVRLVSKSNPSDEFYCEVMPTISENGSVNYEQITPVHHPGTIEKYATTPSREWTISNIKLISLTVAEATLNLEKVNLLRSWRMPYYGAGTEKSDPTKLGAPPDVLEFSAYSKTIGNIPVVLTSVTFDWANDVDYIHTIDDDPFPVILNINISLKEAWSPREYSGFDIQAYKAGNLVSAYGIQAAAKEAAAGTNSNESEAKGEAPFVGPPKPPVNTSSTDTPLGECTVVDAAKTLNGPANSDFLKQLKELPSPPKTNSMAGNAVMIPGPWNKY